MEKNETVSIFVAYNISVCNLHTKIICDSVNRPVPWRPLLICGTVINFCLLIARFRW